MEVPLSAAADHDVLEGTGAVAQTFGEFVEAEHAGLYRALYLVTGSRQESEEIMQDAFLVLWERWDRVSTLERPTGYLFGTAMNLWRKRLRRASLALRKAISLVPNEDPFAAVEDRDMVFRALKQLPPKQRASVVATSFLGYSSEEAGAALGISAASVRMHASRARAAMKQAMEDPR